MSPIAVPTPVAELLDGALELTVVGSFSRVGWAARRRLFGWDEPAPDALEGKVALVTGATSGLGLAAAQGLAGAGAVGDRARSGRGANRSRSLPDRRRLRTG